LSVVISTRNRAERIENVIRAFEQCRVPQHVDWELVIIDNGSSDHTAFVLEKEKQKRSLPLVILHQPVPGKCRSINHARAHLRGDLIIFSDDDMEPCPTWLETYARACRKYPEVSGFTGRVIPVWEGRPPDWLLEKGPYAVPEGVTNCRDHGENEHLLPQEVIPGGGNTALRRAVFDRLGGFREDLGPGTRIPFAEDTELFTRYLHSRGRFCYLPAAAMYHHNPAERLTKSYVVDWVRQTGYCQIVGFKALTSGAMIHGVPRYLILQSLPRLLRWWVEPRAGRRFYGKLRFMHTLGEIQGYLERNRATRSEACLPAKM
jgi:glycosyltransferase involved in cell wall biosynthesis